MLRKIPNPETNRGLHVRNLPLTHSGYRIQRSDTPKPLGPQELVALGKKMRDNWEVESWLREAQHDVYDGKHKTPPNLVEPSIDHRVLKQRLFELQAIQEEHIADKLIKETIRSLKKKRSLRLNEDTQALYAERVKAGAKKFKIQPDLSMKEIIFNMAYRKERRDMGESVQSTDQTLDTVIAFHHEGRFRQKS